MSITGVGSSSIWYKKWLCFVAVTMVWLSQTIRTTMQHGNGECNIQPGLCVSRLIGEEQKQGLRRSQQIEWAACPSMPYHLTIATDHSHKQLQGSYFGSRNGFGHVQGRPSRYVCQNCKKAKSIPDALFVRGFKSITSKMFLPQSLRPAEPPLSPFGLAPVH